ncbi:glycosyltransferase family 32 protein [Pedobacter nyackensis]|uniref:Glycosyltransferase sugar-binding region containing DXD motif-containing protein n=1 Tax=Pedobacter nyackensis TaxID=475255 RepID=A0A1W2AK38_9SPHI|nr:glycosyltransferase [Pedobacter nyackensis]SMC61046.1 Glycosyltransferase sugar-binding region containing DXD motif-containing protein [Pedobacter nyackensis]
MKNELTILIAWHKENNKERLKCFEENKKTFENYNPNIEIVVIVSPFENSAEAWLSSDLSIFSWFNENSHRIDSERFLLLEWDCWCDISAKTYFEKTWDMDVVVPCVKYPERDSWLWFNKHGQLLPERARLYATGIVPFCGILVSNKAMRLISDEILKPDYKGLNSELRFATIATMLGFDPVPNPVCSRAITWKTIIPFDTRFKGIHHPRKSLVNTNVLDKIEKYLEPSEHQIPKIIHQTWKDDFPPSHLNLLTNTWKESHPEWEYILWTDEMNREFIRKFFPGFLLQYDSYEHNIQRVDAVRYFILYKLGGLFIDLDFECFVNIEPLLTDSECVFALEPIEHCIQFNKDKIICNAFMACKPNNAFFEFICNSLSSFAKKESTFITSILCSTGPFALSDIYNLYEEKEQIRILPSGTVYPLCVKETRRAIEDDIDDGIQEKIEGAYAVHYFLGSWY